MTDHIMCSVAGHVGPTIGVSSTSGFHYSLATKPVSSETSKAERRSSGVHGSIWDSWPIAFSGYPRGPRVRSETRCPRHTQRLTFRLRLALEPECLENSTVTAGEDSLHGSRLDPRYSSCLWFQMTGVEAHSSLPHDQNDGGNFSGQGQPRHFRPHAFSH